MGQNTGRLHEEGARDYRLLLRSIENAPLDQEGNSFVDGCFVGSAFWERLEEDEVLRLALVCQQHGLFARAVTLLEWLNAERPGFLAGWAEHLELLRLLGRREDAARLAAVMKARLPGETVGAMLGRDDPASAASPESREDLVDPFLAMRREQEDIDLFLRVFSGKSSAFARQWVDREQEKIGYVPVRRPLSADDVRDHLQGGKTYGIYLLEDDSTVRLGVLDIDLVPSLRDPAEFRKKRDAVKREIIFIYRRITERAARAGLTMICEASGGKGYHFWFPVAAPVQAGLMKKAMQMMSRDLAQDVSCFQLEVFPKQEKVSGKGFGNLVKLPLGVHRLTGRNSRLLNSGSSDREAQFRLLRSLSPAPAECVIELAGQHQNARVIPHPRQAEWAGKFPELATLTGRCKMLGQLVAMSRSSKTLSVKEEKVLLGVFAHLDRGPLLLHHLFQNLPEYNRPLLDYKISRVRGTVIGCKRVHRLLDDQGGELPCRFERKASYPHPLLHMPEYDAAEVPVSEKAANIRDALAHLQTAIDQLQRFL
jgi:hypothetical protein